MSGIGFSEFLILCMIGLIVLGPKRLPKVAQQLGTWVGQARRMTRVMRRQLEEEIDLDKDLNIKPTIDSVTQPIKEMFEHPLPKDDDSYSPLHDKPNPSVAAANTDTDDDDEGDYVSDKHKRDE